VYAFLQPQVKQCCQVFWREKNFAIAGPALQLFAYGVDEDLVNRGEYLFFAGLHPSDKHPLKTTHCASTASSAGNGHASLSGLPAEP